MLVDSHCHIDQLDLTLFDNNMDNIIQAARDNDVSYLLCVCIDMNNFPAVKAIAEQYDNVSASVGVHPNETDTHDPGIEELIDLASDGSIVAIGETGLDYYRTEGDVEWQQQRFRRHIAAAKKIKKPLIVHTRNARADTIQLLKEENAADIGGVMHCFTEDWDMAKKALDLGFYISFSGIVTFKNAKELQQVAQRVPADRMLIETDSPYLAPVPYRGKPNQPAYVKYVASFLAELRQEPYETIAKTTTENFARLFNIALSEINT